MSTFREFNKKCAICGTESKHNILMSTNSFGSPDLDLRPPEMRRSTMWLWIQRCPCCDYVNYDIESESSANEEFLKSYEYSSNDGLEFKSELADRFYKHYKIMMLDRKYMDAYSALLRCAWSCDDRRDINNAKHVRKMAVNMFEKLPRLKKGNENIIAQYIDVLRRCGELDEIIDKFSDFKAKDDVIQKVIDFQIALAKKGDTGVYTVRDALDE
jgi:hypothetical protein